MPQRNEISSFAAFFEQLRHDFGRSDMLLGIDDRLLAPNSDDTLAAVEPLVRDLLARRVAGSAVEVARSGEARDCFAARLRISAARPLAELVDRLAACP